MQTPVLFNRNLLKKRRQKLDIGSEAFSFLCQEVSGRLMDRLNAFKRNFDTCLQFGNDGGILAKSFNCIISDEEFFTCPPNSFDLILSFLGLSTINDIPGVLTQALKALRPDGLFMAVFAGGDSLYELRSVFGQVEIERYKGISNRFMPMISTKDAGYLLGHAGFALPVSDMDRIIVRYASVSKLLQDLKITGNTNVLMDRSNPSLTKGFLKNVENSYQKQFPHPDGGIQVTFDLIYMTGWSPAPNQQKPLKRGSAQQSLKDVL
ncbi:MAG: class I SAM-dependent methyltransferase [Alphaproteobacteria bacterium]|nr:class I SAM-dependent methyltransferase [Alphaproteobacteria bacterium]